MQKQIEAITNMQAGGSINPLAVPIDRLHFSWKLETTDENHTQASYRILVCSTDEMANEGTGDVWDTGKILSGQTLYIPYGGRPLKSGRRYWWRLRIWRDSGESLDSPVQWFETAFAPEDWKGKWIWKKEAAGINEFYWFRKVFRLSEEPERAILRVTSHHHHKLYINGKRTGGEVTPVPSDPVQSKYYVTYDVTGQLLKGENTFCALAHFKGGSGQNYVDGLPGFLLQCDIRYRDGRVESIYTDTDWKYSNTPYRNGVPYQQNRRLSAMEIYDARLEDQRIFETDFDDREWMSAAVIPVKERGWTLKPQRVPEGAAEEVICPIPCGVQQPGLQVFDSGRIVTGWVRLKLEGEAGTCVRLRYSEDMTKDGRVKHNVCNENSENYYDEYILKGGNPEIWEPSFSFKAFRYIEVSGFTEILDPEKVEVVEAHTRLEYRGDFHCSAELLNRIYRACINTQKNNVTGQMVDCPHREQAQYLADSDLQAETFSYNFANLEVLEKVLADFGDVQQDNGEFPFVFPSNYLHPDFSIKIPEWDLHYGTLLWKTYWLSGDNQLLERYYNCNRRMAEHYLQTLDRDTGLLPRTPYWHISDWPYPHVDQGGNCLTAMNCKFYHVLRLTAEMARITGRPEDTQRMTEQAESLGQAILRYLYHPGDRLFRDSLGSPVSSQGIQVLALQAGLVPPEDRRRVLEYIAARGLNCRTLLSLNLLQVLFENGYGQQAFEILNSSEFPGWGHMVARGWQTVWEGFDDMESHCHAWNAYPARLMQQYIAGIVCAAPGFAAIDIKPFLPEGLDAARAVVPTVRGDIHAGWSKRAEQLVIQLRIPAGSRAKLYIPESCGSSCREILQDGNSLWSRRQVAGNAGCPVLTVESGEHEFRLICGSRTPGTLHH